MKDGGQRDIRKGVLRGVKIGAAAIFVIIFLIWSLSPYVIRHYVAEALQSYDIQLAGKSNIRYNPLLSRVTVRDLNLVHGQQTVFRLGNAALELHLHRLLFSDIYINEFELSDVDLHVAIDHGVMNVAGFEFGAQITDTADPQKNEAIVEPSATHTDGQVSPTKTPKNVFPYEVIGPLLRISDASITVLHEQTPFTVNVDDLSIKALAASGESQKLEIGLEARALGGDVSVLSQVNISGDKGEVKNQLDVASIQLQKIQPLLRDQLTQLSGELNVQASSNIVMDGETLKLSLSEAGARVQELSAQLPSEGDHKESLVNLNVQGYTLDVEKLNVNLVGGRLGSTEGQLNTRIDGVGVVGGNNDKLLSLERLAFGSINFTSGADIPSTFKVTADQLQLSNFFASDVAQDAASLSGAHAQEATENTLPPLLIVGDTIVKAIRYEQEKLYLGDIVISDVRSHVFIAEDKTVSTLSALLQGAEENIQEVQGEELNSDALKHSEGRTAETTAIEIKSADSAEGEKNDALADASSRESPQNSVFNMALGKLHLEGENHIIFRDESVSPHYNRDLKIDAFEISKIDSESNELSPFIFKGRSNEYAKIDLTGGVSPLSESVNLKISGNINEIALPAVSSYIRDALGFELKSGQLDTELDVNVDNSELGGSVKLHMRGVDMSAADDAMASMKDQGAIPLNVALGMLKDKRGNIKLSVPMSGSVDDPSFGMSSFLVLVTKKAVMSQAKSYLMNTFVPYASVVSVAISAGEFALKLRFEDLIYSPGVTELEETQIAYAQQFIQLMKDKEKAQIKICGVATPAEVGLPNGVATSDEGSLVKLKTLAKSRSESFKRYVVETGGIESSRMLLCNPDIDFSEKSQPRIKLSI